MLLAVYVCSIFAAVVFCSAGVHKYKIVVEGRGRKNNRRVTLEKMTKKIVLCLKEEKNVLIKVHVLVPKTVG